MKNFKLTALNFLKERTLRAACIALHCSAWRLRTPFFGCG